MTDIAQFITLVGKLRGAQKAYFKDRKQSDLIESKRLEKEVDQWLAALGEADDDPQFPMFQEAG